ncbi:hypothetical protein ACFQ1M_06940 [Sungkyunkwania multivorans]|uniref:Uncharacterized protein n=1 Tax=Sungkyunkwania multivorans TaxID=1173618 RepID=A0ABW3CXZ6_9FLAO
MDFGDILKELKANLFELIGDRVSDFTKEGKKDMEAFLEASKTKLKTWTKLLADGHLTLDDFEWLVKSQKDLLIMQALYQTGTSKIKLGHLKNAVIRTIVDTIKAVVPGI